MRAKRNTQWEAWWNEEGMMNCEKRCDYVQNAESNKDSSNNVSRNSFGRMMAESLIGVVLRENERKGIENYE